VRSCRPRRILSRSGPAPGSFILISSPPSLTDTLARLNLALAGRYHLDRELGAGGMATVYYAVDLKHRRPVAIKVLRPELAVVVGRDRFLREIELAAGLQHPHILGLIDSGEVAGLWYYIMPFVEGESLRQLLDRAGAVPVERALQLGGQIADALDYAHRHGVVHRDIKPENVLLQDGHAAVADFGIALALQDPGTERLTQTGFSLGTPAYMSPEQIAGALEIDGRSDQYSLACLIHELVTGSPAFAGPTAQAVILKHLTEAAPGLPATVPGPAAAAIAKALAKDPADRFATAAEFGAALRGATVAPPPSATIVVLPFEDASPNPDDGFFASGLTDEVIGDLSKIKAIRLISRNTSIRLKGTTKDLKTIGRDFKVRYALTGSVRRAGDALRITAELVDTETDTPVWGEKYSGTVADVFDLQERLSRQIVDALRVTVTPDESERLAARPIDNLVGYERYLVARPLVFSGDPTGLERARALIREALVHTGDNGLLLGLLALSYLIESDVGAPDRGKMAVADELATKALALAPHLPGPYDVKGWAKARLVGNSRASIPWHRKAVEQGRGTESLGYLAYHLATAGATDEAVALIDEAATRSPHDDVLLYLRVMVLQWAGRTDAAVIAAHELGRFDWGLGRYQAGVVLIGCGRAGAAVPYLKDPKVGEGAPMYREMANLWIQALEGPPRHAPQLSTDLSDWMNNSDDRAAWAADLYAHGNHRDRALHWMGIAIDRGFTNDRW